MKNKLEYTKPQAFWIAQIEQYERKFKPWEERSKKIIKRYKQDNPTQAAQFNILWSNIQTLHPAIYSQPPKPNIERRFMDKDNLGLYSSMTLERDVSFYVNTDLFDQVMKQTTLDRLLGGRGSAWVRYVPLIEEAEGATEDGSPQLTDDQTDASPTLIAEDVVVDYVHWCDFGHTWARTWEELRAVWRRVYMSRGELVERFGDIGNSIPLDAKNKEDDAVSKAVIYEIWDKAKRKAIWISKGVEDVLDEQDDPLGLKDFFPCPRPLYATLTNDDLIPVPDFVLYQDQAIELDNMTQRIDLLLDAVKVMGVYDNSANGLDKLLTGGNENKLIPVDGFAKFGDKGLAGVISFFPLAEIVQTITALQQARTVLKNDIYELTGISDIVRGQTAPSETATAQQIKGQFATMRLDYQQSDVARFARDLVVIMTEVIAKHFSMETIVKLSGIKLMTESEKQQIQMAQQQYQAVAQQAQMMGQQPPPPPEIDEETQELLDLPTWEEVEKLIRDDTARSFRIDIETDSTIKADQEADKEARIEFLGAVGSFLQQAAVAPPELQPLLGEMLMFGVRGFKVGRDMENTFETAMKDIKRKTVERQGQPDPAQQALQMEQQMEQQKQEFEMQRVQMQAQIDQQKGQVEMAIKNADLQIKHLEAQMKNVDLQIKKVEAASKMAGVNDANSVL